MRLWKRELGGMEGYITEGVLSPSPTLRHATSARTHTLLLCFTGEPDPRWRSGSQEAWNGVGDP